MMRTAKMIGTALSAVLVCGAATHAVADDGATREPIYPAGIKPIAPYSPAIQTDSLLFVSGQIPYVDGAIPEHASDGTDDVKDQTKIVMDNIVKVLEEAGLTLENALMVNVYLTDLSGYGAFNEVYGPYWTDKGWTPPARAAVEVGALPGSKPGAPVLVEVSVIAGR
ncbi:MAG: RidA family protein [Pseudomonadota bacterium]